jgi:hypothetical protein
VTVPKNNWKWGCKVHPRIPPQHLHTALTAVAIVHTGKQLSKFITSLAVFDEARGREQETDRKKYVSVNIRQVRTQGDSIWRTFSLQCHIL